MDSEESIRSIVKYIFENRGYRVLLAENGAEAVEIYRKRKDEIEVVILDVVMPKMSGYRTFLKLREINPQVKALLSTGLSSDEKAQEALKSGVMGFLKKPYRMDDLLSEVKKALEA